MTRSHVNLRRFPLGLLPLGLLAAGTIAVAAGWSSFNPAFRSLPCQDGWAGCLVDGTVVSPGMVADGQRRLHPAHMRFGFFDGEALPGLSPFGGLSEYSAVAEPVADAAPEPEPAPAPAPAAPAPVARTADPEPATRPAPVERAERSEPVAVASRPSRPAPAPVAVAPTRSEPRRPSLSIPDPEPPPERARPSAIERAMPPAPPPEPEPEPEPVLPAPEPKVAPLPPPPEPEPEPEPATQDAVAMAAAPEEKPAPPVRSAARGNSCDDIIALEAPAMMGQLGAARRGCLDAALASSGSQTQKSKISLLLLVDAEASGDRTAWVRYIKRHLNQIDRSDPNLCMKYAVYLYRSNSGQETGVIRWAGYALENKQAWNGSSYKRNVFTLYKLRAQAANRQWQRADKKFVSDRSDATEAAAAQARGKVKDYAREWLDYARASGQSTKAPLALCVSAAGSAEFCQG